MLKEIIYVFKHLEKGTLIKLGVMVSVTIGMCVLILSTIENPVIERWKEDKKTDQLYEQQKNAREVEGSDKEPVY